MISCNLERYERHIDLPEISLAGQKKLLSAKVLLIGAGGLGAPIALYLAAAGIGHITILDDDVVSLSNLQRQVIYRSEDIGKLKVLLTKECLEKLNPDCKVNAIPERFTKNNAASYIDGHDIIVDGSDNFDTRYLTNEICFEFGIPLVSGAILQFDGQLSVFKAKHANNLPCYKCLYPTEPSPHDVPSCTESAVFGPVPGVIATLSASETIKELLGIGTSLAGHLLLYSSLHSNFRKIRIIKKVDCTVCGKDHA